MSKWFDECTQAGRDRRSLAAFFSSVLCAALFVYLMLVLTSWLVGPENEVGPRLPSSGWTVLMLSTEQRALVAFPCDAEPSVQGRSVLFETEGGVRRFLDPPWAIVPPGV